ASARWRPGSCSAATALLRAIPASPQRAEGARRTMNDAALSTDKLIQHVSELAPYSPPAHSGTVNRRLVGREFGAGFEMILGQVAAGGEASRHYHVEEAQIVYILKGEADIALGEDAPLRCGPGTVIRIPKGLAHEVVTAGDEP